MAVQTPLVSDNDAEHLFDSVSIRAVDVYTRRRVELSATDRQKIQSAMSDFLAKARENTSVEEYLRIRKRIFDLLKELPVSYQAIDSGDDSAHALLNIQAMIYRAEKIKQSILDEARSQVAHLKTQTTTKQSKKSAETDTFAPEYLLKNAPTKEDAQLKQASALSTADELSVYNENGEVAGFYPYGTPLKLTGAYREVDGIKLAQIEDENILFVPLHYLNVTMQVSEDREDGKTQSTKTVQLKERELAFASMRLARAHQDYEYARHKLDTYKQMLEAAKKVESGPNPENGWKIMEAMGFAIKSLQEAKMQVDKWQEETIDKQRQLSDARREFVEKGGTA